MTLLIDSLLTDVETSLQTLDLMPSLKELPYACAAKDWGSLPAARKQGRLLLARGQLLEAARLKARLSTHPYYAKAAAMRDGDAYWIGRAASYGGGGIDAELQGTRYSKKQDQPASAGFSFPDNGSMTPENHRRAISKALAAAEKFRREVENDFMVNGNSNGKSVDWDGLDVDGDGDLTELGNQQYLERQEQLIDSLWPNHCIMLRME